HLLADPWHHWRRDGTDGGDAEPVRSQQAGPWHCRRVRGHDLRRGPGEHVHAADVGAAEGTDRQAIAVARNHHRGPGVDCPGRQSAADRIAPAGLPGMRRKHHDEHVNHEAWAIPYADLMTLLLAFFVVMYAVSVVNECKLQVMSESIVEAFNGSSHVIAPMPSTKVRPHNIQPAIAAPAGQPGSSIVPIAVPIPPHPVPMHGEGRGAHAGFKYATPQENLKDIANQVQKALKPLIDKQQVVVRRTPDWLEIEIRTDILFPSGVA